MSLKEASKRYLLWYANEHVAFRIPEFESLTSLLDIKYSYLEPPSDKPYLMIETNCESKMRKLMSRTVLARSLFELWCYADNYRDFYHQLSHCPMTHLPQYKSNDRSFRIQVEAFGRKLQMQNKIEKIEKLSFLPFEGEINLKNPDNSFNLFEYYGNDSNNIPEEPYNILFGVWMIESKRKMISNLSLKNRKFIANTSMDTTLSLIMANVAKVTDGDLILDPFVGSGSLLVAAAYFGGYVFGTDIDYLLLHGLSKPTRFGVKMRESDENILLNLKQYGLQSKYLDVIVADTARPLWRSNGQSLQFDAIITDPPYGIRESRERIGTDKDNKIPEHLLSGHIPSKIQYKLNDINRDLLDFSAQYLKIGGRIVYWLPIHNNQQFNRESISHPCFKLLSMSEQQLSCDHSRILIVMEKHKVFDKECDITSHLYSNNYTVLSHEQNDNINNIIKKECET